MVLALSLSTKQWLMVVLFILTSGKSISVELTTYKEVTSGWYVSNEGRYGEGSIESVSIYGNQSLIEFAIFSIDCSTSSRLIPNLRYSFSNDRGSKEMDWWNKINGKATLNIGERSISFGRVTEPRPLAHTFMLTDTTEMSEYDFIRSLSAAKGPAIANFTILDSRSQRTIELSMEDFEESLSKLKEKCSK